MKPFDTISGSKCPECGHEVLFKGEKYVRFQDGTRCKEIVWGCTECKIEGGIWQ